MGKTFINSPKHLIIFIRPFKREKKDKVRHYYLMTVARTVSFVFARAPMHFLLGEGHPSGAFRGHRGNHQRGRFHKELELVLT